jgi:hypothetical protein
MKIKFVPKNEAGSFNLDDVRTVEVEAVEIIPDLFTDLNYNRYTEEPGGPSVFRISEVPQRRWSPL